MNSQVVKVELKTAFKAYLNDDVNRSKVCVDLHIPRKTLERWLVGNAEKLARYDRVLRLSSLTGLKPHELFVFVEYSK